MISLVHFFKVLGVPPLVGIFFEEYVDEVGQLVVSANTNHLSSALRTTLVSSCLPLAEAALAEVVEARQNADHFVEDLRANAADKVLLVGFNILAWCSW